MLRCLADMNDVVDFLSIFLSYLYRINWSGRWHGHIGYLLMSYDDPVLIL